MKGTASIERLVHFRCGQCQKWWSIGDAPPSKTIWYCPWCGTQQEITEFSQVNLAISEYNDEHE